MKQSDLQVICEELIDDVDDLLGCALVDLATGLPIASDLKPRSVLTEEAMMLLFAAGASYFMESSLPPSSSPNSATGRAEGLLREVQVTTELTFNFMTRVPDAEQALLFLVTDRSRSSLGLGWMAVRQAQERLSGLDAGSAEPPAAARATTRFPRLEPAPQSGFDRRQARGRRTVWDLK